MSIQVCGFLAASLCPSQSISSRTTRTTRDGARGREIGGRASRCARVTSRAPDSERGGDIGVVVTDPLRGGSACGSSCRAITFLAQLPLRLDEAVRGEHPRRGPRAPRVRAHYAHSADDASTPGWSVRWVASTARTPRPPAILDPSVAPLPPAAISRSQHAHTMRAQTAGAQWTDYVRGLGRKVFSDHAGWGRDVRYMTGQAT